ncbi:unnamed protein product [Adineta steineri]|uniref:EGF-like domain-containing protein n=1 Tax=Adineta steineri TaxID=433720 RepID=A0A814HVG6_9BILA|nr:unnamed protein product [Adineta steineri]CAF3612137.1 unnamed protein product [Adineta steineri]
MLWNDHQKKPKSLFVTSNGTIYIDNGAQGRIDTWSPGGHSDYIPLTPRQSCYGLFVDTNDTIYCSMRDSYTIMKKSLRIKNDSWIAAVVNVKQDAKPKDKQPKPIELKSPHGIFVNVNFDLYVADYDDNSIKRFKSGQTSGGTIVFQNSPKNINITYGSPLMEIKDDYGNNITNFSSSAEINETDYTEATDMYPETVTSSDSTDLSTISTVTDDNKPSSETSLLRELDGSSSIITTTTTGRSTTTNATDSSTTTITTDSPATTTATDSSVTTTATDISATVTATDTSATTITPDSSVTTTTTGRPTTTTAADSSVTTTAIDNSPTATTTGGSTTTTPLKPTIDEKPASNFVAPNCSDSNFIGLSCNISSQPCDIYKPCQNLGICTNNLTFSLGYTCLCQPDFSGTNCETNIHPCHLDTCLHDGNCTNVNSTHFFCNCTDGRIGIHCESIVNYCHNVTCLNKGICQPLLLGYECRCVSSSFTGDHCQNVAQSLVVRQFVSKTFGYIAIIAISVVVGFVVIMDILKYGFGIDPVCKERDLLRRHTAGLRRSNRPKQKLQNKLYLRHLS